MERVKQWTPKAILLAGMFLVLAIQVAHVPMRAGEPIRIGGPVFGPEGAFIVFTSLPIPYRVDDGPLGADTNADTVTRVNNLFAEWQAVATSTVSFTNSGAIADGPAASCFSGGDRDVDTVAEFNCIITTGNPVIFDNDGTITDSLFGPGNQTLGFAGPTATTDGTTAEFTEARAVLNGRFRDGNAANGESSVSEFEATLLHEFGHFLGLGHSQINLNCLTAIQQGSCADFGDDTFGLPTMFPIAISGLEESAGVSPERTLSDDDIAWVSRLYPDANFNSTFGTLSGTVFFSDGATHAQGVNVIARRVDDPGTPGIDESRRHAVSVVSGYRYTENRGQTITGDNDLSSPGVSCSSVPSLCRGSRDPALRGTFDMVVLGGFSYNLDVEAVHTAFVGGSNVGPFRTEQFPLPGASPGPIQNVAVSAGGTASNLNFTLTGTAATFDSFDSALVNDTIANATPVGNGTTSASISPFGQTGSATEPDRDIYKFTALANTMVTLEIFARRAPVNSLLDPVIEVLDSNGARVNLCRATPGSGAFDQPCLNDDINPGIDRDSILEFQSSSDGIFFLRVFDWRGDARPDLLYNLEVTGAGQAPPPAGCDSDFDGGGGSNDFNTAANWNPDGVPTGAVCIGATFTVNHAAGSNTVSSLQNVAGTLNITGGTLSVTSSIAVGGTLNIAGGTLNAPASNITTLTMNSGTLNFNGPIATVLSLTYNGGTMNAASGTVNVPGYTHNGGALRLNGGSVSAGATITLAGGLIEGGTPGTLTADIVHNGGTISPGLSPGILNLTGNYTENVGGLIDIEIAGTGGPGAANGHDQLNATGTAVVNGTLRVILTGGFIPNIGDSFTVATAAGGGSGSTTFDFSQAVLPAGRTWTDATSTANSLILSVIAVSACTITSAQSGDWSNAATWTGGVVPTATDDVCVDDADAVTVSSGAQAANSLTVTSSAVFTLSGGSLDLAAASTIGAGGFTQTGGTLSGAGNLTITGAFNWSGGTQSGTGLTIVSSPFSGTGTPHLDGRTLRLDGISELIGDVLLQITAPGMLDNQSTGTLDATATNGNLEITGTGSVRNAGILRFQEGLASSFRIRTRFENSGTVQVNSGILTLDSVDSSSGDWSAAATSILFLAGGTPTFTGNFSGAGEIQFGGGIVANLNAGNYNVTNTTLVQNSATVNFNSGVTLTNLGSTVNVIGNSTLNVSSGGGILNIPTLTVTDSTFTGSRGIAITSSASIDNATVSGNSAFEVAPLSTLNFTGGASIFDTRIFTNNGTVNFNSLGLTLQNGARIENNSIFNAQTNAPLSGGIFNNNLGATFNQVSTSGPCTYSTVMNNFGSMVFAANSSAIQFTAGGTGDGNWLINSGALVILGDGTFTLNGPVTGAGNIDFGATSPNAITSFGAGAIFDMTGTTQFRSGSHTFTAASTVNSVGTVTVSGGTVDFSSGETILPTGTFTQSAGTVTGSDTLTINGSFVFSGGTQSGAGITNANGGITMSTAFGRFFTGRTLNNTGVATLSGSGGLTLSGGAVLNNSGTFDVQGDRNITTTGGGSTINNSGTFVKSSGATTTSVSASFNNSGTVQVDSGNVTFVNSYTQTAGATRLLGGNISSGGLGFNFDGGVLESSGTRTINGNVINSAATVRPGGSPDTLNISGNYTQGPGGTLEIELGGTAAGQFDVLAITGTATLDGTLNVLSFGGFTPAAGDAFQVMTYTSATNDFAVKNGLNISTPPLAASAQATFYLLQVPAPADLAVTKTDSPDPVNAGQNLTYTVTVTNIGPGSATNVTLTDSLPANTSFVSATPSQGNCPAPVGNTLTCSLGSLLLNASATVSIVVVPSGAAVPSISNTVSVTAAESDPNAANNTNIAQTTTVNPSADLALTKADSPDPVPVGQNLTYTLTVTNNGPNDATGVTLTDTLPANVTFVSATPGAPTCTESGGVVTCNLGTIASGANSVVTLVVTPQAAALGTITNSTSVTAAEFDPSAANNTNITQTTSVVGSADLIVTKTDSPDPVRVGDTLTYTITIANNGPNDATNVVLTDTLPANVTFVSSTPGTPTCTESGGVVTCNLGTINNGANTVVTIVVTPQAAAVGTINNTASASSAEQDPNPADNSATESTTVQPVADLALTKTDSPDPVPVGQNLTYTLTVTNNGPNDATGVTLTDTLPAGVTFVSSTPGAPTCTESGGVVTCNLGTINSGANSVVTISVTPQAAAVGTINNSASVSANEFDPNAADNSAAQSTTVDPAADLALTKTDSPDPVQVNGTLTYTLTVTNNGPNDATSVTLTDTLPANVTFVSATPGAPTCTESSGVVTCTLGTIPSGANSVVTISVTPQAAAVPSITNTSSATSAVFDPNAADNTNITQSTAVTPVADVSITISDSPDPVNAGANITYTVTVSNAGPNAATNVTASAALPAGLTFVSANATQGTCTFAAGTVTCNVGTLASGASATATVVLTAGAAAVPSVSVTANVAATETDPNAANNSATATTTVNPAADLAVTKSDSPDPVVVGNNVTYTVTVANNGPSPATAVVLTDNLPGTATFVSATPSQGTCSGPTAGVLTCDLGAINAGSNATVTVVVTAPGTPGSITNDVSVASGVADPVAGNNSASASTTVNPLVTPDFSLSVSPAVQNVPAGLPAQYDLTAASTGGFSGTVAFTCSGQPMLSTCTITPAQVSVSANSPGVAKVVVTTTFGKGVSRESQLPPPFDWRFPTLLAGMGSLLLAARRRLAGQRWAVRLAPLMLMLVLVMFAASCVPVSTVSTPPGTFLITIQGTSGNLTHSTTVTLIVR